MKRVLNIVVILGAVCLAASAAAQSPPVLDPIGPK